MQKDLKQYNAETYEITDFDLTEDYTAFLNRISNIPNTPAPHKQFVSNAGISNQKMMVYVKDIGKDNKFVPVLCDIKLGVDLKHYRGIHMSRCIQSIFELADKKFNDLNTYAETLANIVREKQGSEVAFVDVTGTYIHRKLTKRSERYSFDSLYLISKVMVTKDEQKTQTGMQVYNVTACPCTKAYIKYMIAPELKDLGLTTKQVNEILKITIPATHTQRGITTLLLDKESSDVSHQDLYMILDKSTHLAYDLLKRPDEHDLVIRALKKPQFTEDVAREVTDNAYYHFKDTLSSNAEIYVESVLNDAIHIHDVRTVIKKTFGEIQEELNQ